MGDARLFVRGALRLAEPMHDGELAACRLAGSVALLLDLRGEVPPTPRTLGGLRELLAADESAAEIIGATVDDSVCSEREHRGRADRARRRP
jgi:hypothetical protein